MFHASGSGGPGYPPMLKIDRHTTGHRTKKTLRHSPPIGKTIKRRVGWIVPPVYVCRFSREIDKIIKLFHRSHHLDHEGGHRWVVRGFWDK